MATLHKKCPTCDKVAKLKSELITKSSIILVYGCGHIETRVKKPFTVRKVKPNGLHFHLDDSCETCINHFKLKKDKTTVTIPRIFWAEKKVESYYCDECDTNHDRHHAYKFQREGVEFLEKNRASGLVADAMGLGKTIQALMLLKRNKEILFPTLILVKSSTIFQWVNEYQKWVNGSFGEVLPCIERAHLIPGFGAYVVSKDLISRKGVTKLIAKLGIKSIILDEVQDFKEQDSKRTRALIRIIEESDIQFRVALSGTPIKNRATEYFTVLNLLDPANFYSRISFYRQWLIPNDKGIYTRLNPRYIDKFKSLTSKYIIRREKHEVLKNLPDLLRDYQIIDIEDTQIKNSYNQNIDLFRNFLENSASITSTEILGWLAKLRAITGQAKVGPALAWINDFLISTEESLAVGIHHKGVRDSLFYTLDDANIPTLKLSGEDSAIQKNRIANKFNAGSHRVMILNMLAGGVGLNLQSCANALLLERQWSPADEEQFIGRFHRDGQKRGVTVTYMIARGTIDEFFNDLVFKKSEISTEAGITIAPFESKEQLGDPDFLRNFAEFVIGNKL